MHRTLLFYSDAENFIADGYSCLLSKRQGRYKLMSLNENTLRIVQDRLEYSGFIRQDALVVISRLYRDRLDREEQDSVEKKTRSETDPKKHNKTLTGSMSWTKLSDTLACVSS